MVSGCAEEREYVDLGCTVLDLQRRAELVLTSNVLVSIDPLQHHRNVKQDRNTILYLFLANCIHTTGGTVREGSCCHFPFSFNGAQYYHCLLSPKNNERMWCATTPYFEQDRQWGYCPRSSKNYKLFFICQH